jgi:hypothetical protein
LAGWLGRFISNKYTSISVYSSTYNKAIELERDTQFNTNNKINNSKIVSAHI